MLNHLIVELWLRNGIPDRAPKKGDLEGSCGHELEAFRRLDMATSHDIAYTITCMGGTQQNNVAASIGEEHCIFQAIEFSHQVSQQTTLQCPTVDGQNPAPLRVRASSCPRAPSLTLGRRSSKKRKKSKVRNPAPPTATYSANIEWGGMGAAL